MKYKKIAIISSHKKEAVEKKQHLIKRFNFTDYNQNQDQDFNMIIAVGGDGFLLHSLHKYQFLKLPIYGLNYGTIGFLMNSATDDYLMESIEKSKVTILYPLYMRAIDTNNICHNQVAINDVYLLRQKNQAAKIEISINDKVRIERMICDGILVATPAGSTAYNLSLRGPIIPFGAKALALTAISPFRPRNWNGALLPDNAIIKFKIIDHEHRPVSASADFSEIRNIKEVEISQIKSRDFRILFDRDHSLEERIIREQFS